MKSQKNSKQKDCRQIRIHFKLTGTAGQSFGAFNTHGVTLELEGDANDYFGKGLSGARLIVYPALMPDLFRKKISSSAMLLFMELLPEKHLSGAKPANGFAVRNSGANAVVEGIGDHGCEYMTGGRVVILGIYRQQFRSRHEWWNRLCI